jgi:hypothetical protein
MVTRRRFINLSRASKILATMPPVLAKALKGKLLTLEPLRDARELGAMVQRS